MSRPLLNAVPDWLLAVIFIAAAVLFTLACVALVTRFAPRLRNVESGDKTVGVIAMVMTLFALVLAFVIVNLYTDHQAASNNVGAEANSLSSVATDVQSFPARERQLIDLEIARYVREVRRWEFPALRNGRSDPAAQARLNEMIDTLQHYTPRTPAEMEFYRATSDDLEKLAADRTDRVDVALSSVPAPLVWLLVLLAVLALLTTALLKTASRGLDLALCVSIAVSVGAVMVTGAVLEYPFSGTIAVSSAPFERADLNKIVQANPS